MSKVLLVRIVSVLEIVGGLSGVGFVVWSMTSEFLTLTSLAFVLSFMCIDIVSVIAGVALWQGTSFGRIASIALQFIQVPKIVSPTIIFMFSFGFDLWIHLLSNNGFYTVGFQTSFLASNQFFLNVESAPLGFGISVTSVVFLVALFRYRPKRPNELLPPPPPTDFGQPAQVDPRARQALASDSPVAWPSFRE